MQKNKKHLLLFAFLVSLLFSAVTQVYGQRACSPITQYQDAPYWRASLVFTGVVDKFIADKKPVSQNGYFLTDTYTPVFNSVRFTVEKRHRGDVGEKIDIISSFTFKEGEKYFVYALPGSDGKVYQLDNGECGKPPILLTDAKEDIEYADEIATGKIGTRIFGSVSEDRWAIGTPRQNIPLVNIEIAIKSKKHSFTTKTDEKGKFVFKDIPPAEYRVKALTTQGLHEQTFRNSNLFGSKPHTVLVGDGVVTDFILLGSTQKPKYIYRHWDTDNFVFTSLSSIEGKVVGFDGKIPSQQFLWLLSTDKDGKTLLDGDIQYLWTDPSTGKFVFDNIPTGKYRLAINRYNCHSHTNPRFGRNFFPGFGDETEAEIVTVGENDNIKLKDFRLLPELKERQFSGVVFTADKKPLANATVFMTNKNSSSPNECFSINVETKTDESGHFRLKGYDTYAYKIRAYIEPTEQGSSSLISKIYEPPINDDVENIELIVEPSN